MHSLYIVHYKKISCSSVGFDTEPLTHGVRLLSSSDDFLA